MFCYRDMTFCPYHENCLDSKDCHRALTDEVKEKAKKWWGSSKGEPPICVFAEEPECFRTSKSVAKRLKCMKACKDCKCGGEND